MQRDQLARSNNDVEAEGQMRTMMVHCSMMNSDTAHIDNEVEILAHEDGLTIDDYCALCTLCSRVRWVPDLVLRLCSHFFPHATIDFVSLVC